MLFVALIYKTQKIHMMSKCQCDNNYTNVMLCCNVINLSILINQKRYFMSHVGIISIGKIKIWKCVSFFFLVCVCLCLGRGGGVPQVVGCHKYTCLSIKFALPMLVITDFLLHHILPKAIIFTAC